ncbi:hypothetical protein HYV82_00420 [Candidatus Woesearchaeota archaeon]|nr:hypothetical protein [Candidatus Woesearchaeota archaeon]
MTELLGIGISALAVILIRLLVPFSIFRWPLWGGLAAVIADTLDVVIITVLDPNNTANFYLQHYTELDKALDIYFLLFMMIVSLRWKEKLAKWTSISLFAYRAIGVATLEITHIRQLLFVFPNLFVWWFFLWEVRNKYMPNAQIQADTQKAGNNPADNAAVQARARILPSRLSGTPLGMDKDEHNRKDVLI